VITAAANKLARVAWAVLSSGQEYRPPTALIPSAEKTPSPWKRKIALPLYRTTATTI
jgi:hypothetical protein